MRKNLLLTPIVMILVTGAALSAQETTGTLTGRVTGQDGRGLRGVHVQVTSTSLLSPRQFVTDDNGQFRAALLPGGTYTITYSLSGYVSRRLTATLAASQTIRADAQLRSVEALTTEVEIIASAQQVDKTDTIVQTVYNQDKLMEIFGGASRGNVVGLAAGTGNDGNQIAIRGGTLGGTKFMVDGSGITNMAEGTGYGVVFPMPEAIESIAVLQSPLNARYGNSDGGLISFVLKKGSNDFHGAVRVTPSRTGWGAVTPSRQNNRGVANVFNPSDDRLSKSYQFNLSGPLWKDRITFSWNGNVSPTSRTNTTYYYSVSGFGNSNGDGIWIDRDNASQPYRNRIGTYYQNPATGEVIRLAELLEASDPYNTINRQSSSQNDTWTLYWQVSQNHQLEWQYHESGGWSYNGTNYGMADMNANVYRTDTGSGFQRRWTLGYKGIIGQYGLLEARIGRSNQAWSNTYMDGRPKHSVRVYTMASVNPINPNGDLNDPNNYLASGLIDAFLSGRNDGNKNTIGMAGYASYNFNANNEGPGDTATNEPITINYQHLLQTNHGQHIIDVGIQREKSAWVNPNLYNFGGVNAERLYHVPGRIALDLTPGDVFGYAGTPMSEYAGKFIVYNMDYATFGSIDPYGFSRFNTGGLANEPTDPNQRLIDYQNGYMSGQWPRVYEQYGGRYSSVYVQTQSYYLNDLWTINDYHSLMAGVRVDNFKTWDEQTGRDIYSYSLPTFRFDYKWDISGDQRRIVNVSWGQFHNMPAVSTFAPFISSGVRERLWKQPGKGEDGKPYLVSFEEIMDLNNYPIIRSDTYRGEINEIDPSFKVSASAELTVGIRLNLENGGYLRAAFVTRTYDNQFSYEYNGWKDNPSGDGTQVYSRILRNNSYTERSYNSFELEWMVPVTRRLDFGGSWTFARLMRNDVAETNAPQKSADKTVHYINEYNQYSYPHYGWNPVRLQDSEQRYATYINYDLDYGKVKSNVAFRFTYTTGSPATRSYGYQMGYPIVPGINDNPAGIGILSPAGATLANNKTVYYNINRTGMDSWSTNLTYNLEMPLVNKLRWFATITMSNPFNHAAKSGWYNIDGWVGSGNVVPETILRPDGTVMWAAVNPYAIGGMKSDNVQNTNANLFAPNQVVGGRSIGLTTGLRF